MMAKKTATAFAGAETPAEEQAEMALVKKTGSVKKALQRAKKTPKMGKKGQK